MSTIRLFRDVLDNQIIDRNGRQGGKVDGIVAELRSDGRLELVAIECGMAELTRRLHPRLGDLVAALGRRMGIRGEETHRIPLSKVRNVGINVDVDFDATTTPIYDWEHWLRRRVFGWIPGSGV